MDERPTVTLLEPDEQDPGEGARLGRRVPGGGQVVPDPQGLSA
jgi:hypothetical protein